MSHQQPDDEATDEEVPPAVIKYVFPIPSFVGIAAAGFFVLEQPAVGVLSAAMVAVGEFFSLGFFFEEANGETGDETDDGFEANDADGARFVHPFAVGGGLSTGGIVIFALYMSLETLATAVGGGLAAGLVIYLILSVLFSR